MSCPAGPFYISSKLRDGIALFFASLLTFIHSFIHFFFQELDWEWKLQSCLGPITITYKENKLELNGQGGRGDGAPEDQHAPFTNNDHDYYYNTASIPEALYYTAFTIVPPTPNLVTTIPRNKLYGDYRLRLCLRLVNPSPEPTHHSYWLPDFLETSFLPPFSPLPLHALCDISHILDGGAGKTPHAGRGEGSHAEGARGAHNSVDGGVGIENDAICRGKESAPRLFVSILPTPKRICP